MEENDASLFYNIDTGAHPRPSGIETDDSTGVQPGRRQMKTIVPSDQWTAIQEAVSMLKGENTRLMQERESLIWDLEECKSDLLKRMPRPQISDDSVRKASERIRVSIDDFVYEVMRDSADDALLKYCGRKQHKHKQKKRKSLKYPITKDDINAWGPYECSNFYILSVIIQRVLDEFVSDSKYPIGITAGQIRVLDDIEKGILHAGQIQAEKDRLNVWRSETLTALTTLREYKMHLECISRDICTKLNDILSPWLLEAGPFARVEERFRQEILDPAIKLHRDIRSSSHPYETRYIRAFDGLPPKRMLDAWCLKDADTWQIVRSERGVGRALYCLHPAIIRHRAQGTIPVVVAKAVIVVESPDRDRYADSHGLSSSGLKVPPAVIKPIPAPDHMTSYIQTEFSDNTPMTTDNESSTTDSRRRRRRLSSHTRRASTDPLTRECEDRSEIPPPQRRLSFPMLPWSSAQQEDHHRHRHPGDLRSDLEWEERESTGETRHRKHHRDVVLPYTRGHYIEGSSYTHQSQAAVRQPARKPSRDAQSSLHTSASIAARVQSPPGSDKYRGFNLSRRSRPSSP